MLSTTDRNISTNARTIGIGNGIYKSTDNGATWQPLTATQGGSQAYLNVIFQGVWRIVTDPVRLDNARTGDPIPAEVTGSNFPVNAFVACIDIDPDNATTSW